MRNTTVAALALSALMALGGSMYWLERGEGGSREQAEQPPSPPEAAPDPAAQPEGLPRRLAQLLSSQHDKVNGEVRRHLGRVYYALRADGLRLHDGWATGTGWQKPLLDAIARDVAARPELGERVDAVEVCVPHSLRDLEHRDKGPIISNIHRGIFGLELERDGKVERFCPTRLVANNRPFKNVERDYKQAHSLDTASYKMNVSARRFRAHQLLLRLGDEPAVLPMLRGNAVVKMAEVNSKSVHALAEGMSTWMRNQLQDDGRMIYKWWPSRGRESTGNNMIRQYMASVCLVRMTNRQDDPELRAGARRNLMYNFSQFYRQQGEHGLISWQDKSKLGSAALAALAIVEAPFRGEFTSYEEALLSTTFHLQNDDGSFFTFYGTTRNDNQNFYPGETQLLWATLWQQNQDAALLKRIMSSMRYYRSWHMENRNPAFIPWHTQAYFRVWQKNQDPELADWIFKMNDWLLGVQQWETARYPDVLGRFYAPDRPFGPPHASSTGVYLEGLIDAYRLAVALKDGARSQAYKNAIMRGLRSLMQLQFVDDVDMYYVTQRDRVRGGLRTTVYDNGIRVDNVQHSLMGLMRILDTFDAEGEW